MGRIGRRSLLAGVGGLVAGGLIGLMVARRDQPMPLDGDGFPTAHLEVGDAHELAERIDIDGPVILPADGGRIAIARWDPSYQSDRGAAMERYGAHPQLDDTIGLLVLSLVSTHLGCRVVYCASSRWFEDPCHGSRWNSWGEWAAGPAPRGLDRYGSTLRADGVLVVDLTRHLVGTDREFGVLEQEPAGPSCTDG